jgi:L-seryl-tRNA(Ser) seleniumtransferase
MSTVARDAQSSRLASLPSVDRILAHGAVVACVSEFGREATLAAARRVIDAGRDDLRADPRADISPATLATRIGDLLRADHAPRQRRVINLTGTVLHTNLGRSPLPEEAVRAVVDAMTSPTNLEYDVETGRRGDRDELVAPLLRELTGCEAATIVNNNAAAVLLALATLARGREVIVSRGEQIEIGGAFRLPDVMARAGCKLHEVGTTNRTHLADYADAIGPRTGLILKVHRSNYAITGFTSNVDEAELGALARRHGIPFMVDLGSGALVDLSRWGLPKEPTVRATLANGASLVTFSGDKLLGGPQAGLVVGAKDVIGRMKKNPLKRALRVDKMTLAALEAVLRLYRDPDRLASRLTTLRLLARPQAEILDLAARLLPAFEKALGDSARASIGACMSQIGSGAQPLELLPSAAIVVTRAGRGPSLQRLEQAFRKLPTPVIGRIAEDALRFDLRCVQDEAELEASLKHLAP